MAKDIVEKGVDRPGFSVQMEDIEGNNFLLSASDSKQLVA